MAGESGFMRGCGCAALGFVMSFAVPTLANAAAVSINDLVEGTTTIDVTGVDSTSLSTQTTAESADAHFEYMDATPLANGVADTVNFNIAGPGEDLSDTLNITVTGHLPTAGDPNNTSVDLHFRSDIEGATLSALVNAFVVAESGSFQDVSAVIHGRTGLSDLFVSFASDTSEVPLPATLPLFATGLGGLGLFGWRRKRKAQATL